MWRLVGAVCLCFLFNCGHLKTNLSNNSRNKRCVHWKVVGSIPAGGSEIFFREFPLLHRVVELAGSLNS